MQLARDKRNSRTALMGFVAEAFGLRVSFYTIATILLCVVSVILALFARRMVERHAGSAHGA